MLVKFMWLSQVNCEFELIVLLLYNASEVYKLRNFIRCDSHGMTTYLSAFLPFQRQRQRTIMLKAIGMSIL